MSIEKKIDELIQALGRNIEALDRNTLTLHAVNVRIGPEVREQAEAAGERILKQAEKIIEKVALEPQETITEKVALEPQETITEADEEKPELKYEDMVTAFRQFIGKNGRDKAAEILTKFGITGKLTADQLPESKYQEFLDKLK